MSVNGNEVVALASEEDARGALSDLRAEYIRGPSLVPKHLSRKYS